MKNAIGRLLSSMKTWTLVIGLTATFLAKYGIHVDSQTAQFIAGGFALLLGMQGVTDHGKAAAEILAKDNQAARVANITNPPSPPPTPPSTVVTSGTVNVLGMLLLVCGLSLQTGCSWFSRSSKTLAKDLVDCTTATAKSAVVQFAPVVEGYLVRAIDGNGHVDTEAVKSVAKSFVPEIGGCVLADVFARALKPAPANPSAPAASPLTADPASLHETFEAVRAQLGGKTFHTANGDL